MIISFVNQKGGVGKSTLSVHFASWLKEQKYSVSFYDADAQMSSTRWLAACDPNIALDRIDPSNTDVVPEQVLKLAEQTDFTICDGPGGLGENTRTLLVVSDFAFFPITPSFLDAASLQKARSQLNYANTLNPANPPLARVILNRTKTRSRLLQDARSAENGLGIPVFKNIVRDLDAFRLAAQDQTVVWKLPKGAGINAGSDLKALFTEVMELVSQKMQKEMVANG